MSSREHSFVGLTGVLVVLALAGVPAGSAAPDAQRIIGLPGALGSGASEFMNNFGESDFATSVPCPVKQFPTLEALAPVPQIIDPFEDDIIPVFCQISFTKDGKPVKGVRGNMSTDLIIRDEGVGSLFVIPLGTKVFNTGSAGVDALAARGESPH